MSSSSHNQHTTAVSGGMGKSSTPANNVGSTSPGATGDNRRGSQSSGLFSGLMSQKRNSADATANARRQSFADQKPEAGVLGKMWNNFTAGSSPPK